MVKRGQAVTMECNVKSRRKPFDIKELHMKTVRLGDAVTMECNITEVRNKNSLAWYRQSFGKIPQFLARQYSNTQGYIFSDGSNDSHFSVTVKDQKFDLNINKTREDDGGEYFCGYVEGSTVKFTSGTRLQFEGEEMKPCPTPGTLNKNNSSKNFYIFSSPHTPLYILSSSNVCFICTDQMCVMFWLSVTRVGVLVFIIFPVILIVFKYK
ncbi:uncharacterized protein Hap1MRO34_001661 [Clarias gariepinus]